MPPGTVVWSLESEDTVAVAEIWSAGAAMQRDAFWSRILRDRCAMREALQVANGGTPVPDDICRPRQSAQSDRSHASHESHGTSVTDETQGTRTTRGTRP